MDFRKQYDLNLIIDFNLTLVNLCCKIWKFQYFVYRKAEVFDNDRDKPSLDARHVLPSEFQISFTPGRRKKQEIQYLLLSFQPRVGCLISFRGIVMIFDWWVRNLFEKRTRLNTIQSNDAQNPEEPYDFIQSTKSAPLRVVRV